MASHQTHSTAVYQVLDDIISRGVVPPGARGTIAGVVDELRCAASCPELRQAECISLQIHRLEWSRQNADTAGAEAAQTSLRQLASEWLDARIRGSLPTLAGS